MPLVFSCIMVVNVLLSEKVSQTSLLLYNVCVIPRERSSQRGPAFFLKPPFRERPFSAKALAEEGGAFTPGHDDQGDLLEGHQVSVSELLGFS